MKKSGTNEKGSALVLTMLIIGSLLTFGTVSIYSAADKYMQVSKERLEREAFHLSDAGISEGAAQLKLDDADGFNDAELTGSYLEEMITIGSTIYEVHIWIDTTTVSTRKYYKVWLTDNYDVAYTSGRSNDQITADDTDVDLAVLLVSKGWLTDEDGNERASAIVKGLFKRVPYDPEFAILTGGDLTFNGNISVTGSEPSVHTNSNFTSIGGSDQSQGAVTASGTVSGSVTLTGGGTTGSGNIDRVDIPTFTANYYRSKASSLVRDTTADPIADGDCERAPPTGIDCVEICNSGGTYTVSSPSPASGAICSSAGGANNASGVFYFGGPVDVDADGAWAAVVLATGDVTLTSNTEITGSSALAGVGIVSDGSIMFSGSVIIGSPTNQLGMYSVGVLDLGGGGSKTLNGPMIALDTAATSSLSGVITVVYNNNSPPLNGPLIGKLISWTQVE